MQKDPLAGFDQSGERVQCRRETHGHVVGAAVVDGRMHELEAQAIAFTAQFRGVEAVDLEVDVVLQIVDRSDAKLAPQPGQILEARIFADQQMLGDLTDGRARKAAAHRVRSIVGSAIPPIHWGILSCATRMKEACPCSVRQLSYRATARRPDSTRTARSRQGPWRRRRAAWRPSGPRA